MKAVILVIYYSSKLAFQNIETFENYYNIYTISL